MPRTLSVLRAEEARLLPLYAYPMGQTVTKPLPLPPV